MLATRLVLSSWDLTESYMLLHTAVYSASMTVSCAIRELMAPLRIMVSAETVYRITSANLDSEFLVYEVMAMSLQPVRLTSEAMRMMS